MLVLLTHRKADFRFQEEPEPVGDGSECVESIDLPDDRDVDSVRVDPSLPPSDRGNSATVKGHLTGVASQGWPYLTGGTTTEPKGETIDVALIPYHDWANRGPATMRVWIPTSSAPSGSI